MQDAYFSVSIENYFRRNIKFIGTASYMPLFVSHLSYLFAPRLFTKLLKPIFAWFRQQAIRCLYYIDDSLNMDRKKDVCAKTHAPLSRP